MSKLMPIEGSSSMRNSVSGAIVNVNKREVDMARLRKATAEKKALELNETNAKVDRLQEQMDSLDHKLNLILEKL